MLPNPRVFRSRWSALFWAAGVVWLAINVAGTGNSSEAGRHTGESSQTDRNDAAADADTRQALNTLESMN